MRLGHRVTRINHLGDWGSQFGKLVAAWNNWGNEKSFRESPISHLLELYVRFHEEETNNPDLADQAKKAFSELETEEDGETHQLWQRFTEASLQEFEQIYSRLGVSFEHIRGESWYENQLESLVEWLDSCGVLEESEGAQIINLTEPALRRVGLGPRTHVWARPELSRQVGENKAGCDRIDDRRRYCIRFRRSRDNTRLPRGSRSISQ